MLTKKHIKLIKRKIECNEPIKIPYRFYQLLGYGERWENEFKKHLSYKRTDESDYWHSIYLEDKYYVKVGIQLGFINEKNLRPSRLYFLYKGKKMIEIF